MTKQRINTLEGRAIAARPLACLTGVLVAVVVSMTGAAAAQAAPTTPVLTGTTPKSPNTTLTPLVKGSSTGIIISALPGVGTASMVTAAEGDPVIEIYEGVGCPGEPVAEGTPEELDGDGIEVTVEPESTTLFSARQTDETGSSGCSNAIQYQHVKELPPVEEPPPGGNPPGGGGAAEKPNPPRLRTVPGSWSNDNTPLVTGSAPGADTVRIYADPKCEGQPVAKGSLAQFSAGFKVTVVDNDVTVFSGVSVARGEVSNCSAPILYVEDSLTPRTRITMGPAAKTRKRNAIFRFVDSMGDAPGTVFRCKVDKRKWKKCASPLKLKGLTRKPHVLRVKATDAAGNVERRGAKRRFKVIARP